MVDLKTFLGLAMSNQSCLDVTKQMLSWFLGDILGLENFQTLMIPVYSTTVLYDNLP